MRTLSNLNGWQRIGLILVAAWTVLVLTFVAREEQEIPYLPFHIVDVEVLPPKIQPKPLERPTNELRDKAQGSVPDKNPFSASEPGETSDSLDGIEDFLPRRVVSINWLGLATSIILPPLIAWLLIRISLAVFAWVARGFSRRET